MQAPMMNEQDFQQQELEQQQQQQQPEQEVDEVALAKQALGLDKYEQDLQLMKTEMEASKSNALFKEVSANHSKIDPTLVQAEIKKLEETNPEMANMFKSSKEGIDMLFKKVIAEMKPKEEPDDLHDSAGSQTGNNDIGKKIKEGTASEVDLGDFILENS